MLKTVFGALLAAVAFVPAAAQPQQRDGTDDAPRPFRQMREAQAQPEQQAQARFERPAQPEQRFERPQVQVQADGQGGWRGNRGGGEYRGRADVPATPSVQAQGGYEAQRDGQRRREADRPNVPWTDTYRDHDPQQRGPDGSRFDARSQIDTRSQLDTRSRFEGHERFDTRGAYGTRYDNRTPYDNRGYDGRGYDARGDQGRSTFGRGFGERGNGYSNGNRWNRDWRRDDRYDWTRYRSSNRDAYHLPRYYAPNGWDYGYRRFSAGVTLSSVLWGQNYWIDDPSNYRLPEAYGPYRWVRYFNDALLVDLRTGLVVDSVYGIFW